MYDFEHVDEIDSTIGLIFDKINSVVEKQSIILILTGLSKTHIYNKVNNMYVNKKQEAGYLIIPDSDKALEYYEELVLIKANYQLQETINFSEFLYKAGIPKEVIKSIVYYFDEISLQKGEYLFHQKDTSQELYYLESGKLNVLLQFQLGKTKRILSINAGNIIGEMAFYLSKARTASIYAEENCVLSFITPENFEKMLKDNPTAAAFFNKMLVSSIAKHISIMNAELQILLAG